jgi:hypothetical protein
MCSGSSTTSTWATNASRFAEEGCAAEEHARRARSWLKEVSFSWANQGQRWASPEAGFRAGTSHWEKPSLLSSRAARVRVGGATSKSAGKLIARAAGEAPAQYAGPLRNR